MSSPGGVDTSAPKAKAGMMRRARDSLLENKLAKMRILRNGSSSSGGDSFNRSATSGSGVGFESEVGSREVPRNASAKAAKLLGLDDGAKPPARPTLQPQLTERFLSRRDRNRLSQPANDVPMQSLLEDEDLDLDDTVKSLHLGSGRAIKGEDGQPWGYMVGDFPVSCTFYVVMN